MKLVQKAFAFCILISLVSPSHSDDGEEISHLEKANQLFTQTHQMTKGKALVEQISIVEKFAQQHADDFFIYSMLTQDLSWRYSRAGLHSKAIEAMDATYGKDEGETSEIANYTAVPAAPEILKLASNYPILMLNEAHHNAQHRVFTYRLLDKLWDEGFRYFAAEVFLPECEQELEKAYVTPNCGFYSQEPIFANLILKAKEMGFQIISYDNDLPNKSQTTEERETNAASVIQGKVFAKDPDAKLVVHVGYAHINEKDWLAGKLSQLTGLEILTVNQVSHTERSRQDLESPIYKHVAKNLSSEPVALSNGEKFWCEPKKECDIEVFWPRTRFHNNRPEWASLGRHSIEMDSSICKGKAPCLVEVLLHDKADEVPSDRIVIDKADGATSVFLQQGRNTVIVTGADGSQLSKKELDI
ncbi:hypothetical protein K0504_11970 [Neiella marina]|uniref:Haem-binding uptake Tiki superfamily ChaN domain-containing protein n=1 Tax=Neiella holothuriorum TaxID=2870530 RepID=A0ABS7EIP2_9GAMM|nr:hypothetical protein [Neiella holothuriorum]MBW8191753.1 hypothetical protein [Neiella holothuriorum]